MIKPYDKVRIKSTGADGVVVDIRGTDKKIYMVERDDNELIDCVESELEVKAKWQ